METNIVQAVEKFEEAVREMRSDYRYGFINNFEYISAIVRSYKDLVMPILKRANDEETGTYADTAFGNAVNFVVEEE